MADYTFHTMLASLHVYDIPLGYSAARGPDVEMKVSYNMREAGQPSSKPYTHFSPLWECAWVSYLEDNPALPAADVTIQLRGGGAETHTGYNSNNQSFVTNRRWNTTLVRIDANTYERRHPDGSKEVYARAIGTSAPRKVFLSSVVDPQGNAVSVVYDNNSGYQARIQKLVDATGLETTFSYAQPSDPFLVTSIADPFGRTATFNYAWSASAYRLQTITDTIGIQSTFEYNSSGQVNALVTPYGRTTFAFATPNTAYGLIRWIEATDPSGDKERIEYNLGSATTGIPNILPASEMPTVSGYWFNPQDMDDRNTFYWDKKAWATAPGDYSKAHLFHWLQVDGADVASGILECEKKAFESRVWYRYPGQDPLTDSINIGTSPHPCLVARKIEDGVGGTTTACQKYEHNAYGNPTKQIDELGRENITEYATNGMDVTFVKQKVSGNYQTLLSCTYDPAYPPHCPKTITDAAGQTTTLTYNTAGQPLTVTNALLETTTIIYDPVTKRPTQVIGPVPGATVNFAYDGFERVRTVTDSAGYSTTTDYDALDRPTLVTYPDQTTEQFVYDRMNLHAQKDRENRWTRTWHNALKQPYLQQDALGRQTFFEWCKCGDLKSFKDAKNQLTSWKHDAQGRITEKLYPDGRKEIPTYEPLSGRLATMTDPLLQVKTFAYFLDGSPRSVTHSNLAAGTAATPNSSFTHDPYFSRISTITRGTETTTLGYHPVGQLGALRLASIDGHFAGTSDLLAFTYDALGRMKTRNVGTSGTDHQTTWNFDSLGRLDNLVNTLGSFQNAYVAQTERLQEILYPNGQKTTFGYFPTSGDHRLQTIHHFANATDTLSRYDYTYTPSGNIATWQRQFGSAAASKFTLGYSRADELTSAVLADVANPTTILKRYGYQYDPAGNRTSAQDGTTLGSASHDNANRLTAIAGGGKLRVEGSTDEPAKVKVNGSDARISPGNLYEAWVDVTPGPNTLTVQATDYSPNANVATKSWSINITGTPARSFAHDDNGNMTSDGTRTYEWDADNRLVKITWGAGSNKTTEYKYNPLGQRSERIEKTGSTETAHQYYLFDGIQTLCRYTGGTASTNLDRRYYGEGEQRKNGASWNNHYYTRDHLGSIREVTNNDATLAARYDYDPYGKRSTLYQAAGYTDGCDFGYTGHDIQPSPVAGQTELVLTHFRAYDTELGRWLSADPIGEAGGMNLYGYVLNDPITHIDSDGLQAIGPGGGPAGITAKLAALKALAQASKLMKETSKACDSLKKVAKTKDQIDEMIAAQKKLSDVRRAYAEALRVAREAGVKKVKVPGLTPKEAAKDIPTWVDDIPGVGECGKQFARRMMDSKYPNGWSSASKEFSEIKKWGDRAWRDPLF